MKEKDKKETQEIEGKPQAPNNPARKEERISDLEKGMTSAYPEIGNQPWTFKEIEAKKKGRMKNKE